MELISSIVTRALVKMAGLHNPEEEVAVAKAVVSTLKRLRRPTRTHRDSTTEPVQLDVTVVDVW